MANTEIKGNGPPETVRLIEDVRAAKLFSQIARIAFAHENGVEPETVPNTIAVFPHTDAEETVHYVLQANVELEDVVDQTYFEVSLLPLWTKNPRIAVMDKDGVNIGKVDYAYKSIVEKIEKTYRTETDAKTQSEEWARGKKSDASRYNK